MRILLGLAFQTQWRLTRWSGRGSEPRNLGVKKLTPDLQRGNFATNFLVLNLQSVTFLVFLCELHRFTGVVIFALAKFVLNRRFESAFQDSRCLNATPYSPLDFSSPPRGVLSDLE